MDAIVVPRRKRSARDRGACPGGGAGGGTGGGTGGGGGMLPPAGVPGAEPRRRAQPRPSAGGGGEAGGWRPGGERGARPGATKTEGCGFGACAGGSPPDYHRAWPTAAKRLRGVRPRLPSGPPPQPCDPLPPRRRAFPNGSLGPGGS